MCPLTVWELLMPELPEVETTRVGISPHIEGQTLQHLVVRDRSRSQKLI